MVCGRLFDSAFLAVFVGGSGVSKKQQKGKKEKEKSSFRERWLLFILQHNTYKALMKCMKCVFNETKRHPTPNSATELSLPDAFFAHN